MPAKTLMIQGTSSHAGKSILTTAFCRLFAQEGFRVAPFKSQNMSLNSFVTANGEEIAVAQAVQAEAAGVDHEVEMNPILLKPTEDCAAQVIVMGRPVRSMDVFDYDEYKEFAWNAVVKSYDSLAARYEVIVIEGAGSPVEMNLKDRDIVNMKIAELAEAPVIIVTDIDRGGVIASLVGTMELLEPAERDRVIGFVINKFRGERKLLDSALEYIEKKTGKPVLGVIPFLHHLRVLSEDSVSLESPSSINQSATTKVAVVMLPHMSNFTDFAPLELEPEVSFKYLTRPEELDDQDLVIIPGSKNTISDMAYLWKSGFAAKLKSLAGRTMLLGICGGYQMLGREILDPDQVESDLGLIEGLGLIDAVTVLKQEKRTMRVEATALSDVAFFRKGEVYSGFEIHMGKTTLAEGYAPLFQLDGSEGADGVIASGGKILGTYLHGLFDNDPLRRDLIGSSKTIQNFQEMKSLEYDRLAQVLRDNLNLPLIKEKMGIDGRG